MIENYFKMKGTIMKSLLVLLFLFSSVSYGHTNVCKMTNQIISNATTTDSTPLAANNLRKCLIIQNVSNNAVNVIIKLNSSISTTEGLQLAQFGGWEPVNVPLGAIHMKSVSGTQSVYLMEGK